MSEVERRRSEMKIDLFGLIEFEIDWKAVIAISLAQVVVALIQKM